MIPSKKILRQTVFLFLFLVMSAAVALAQDEVEDNSTDTDSWTEQVTEPATDGGDVRQGNRESTNQLNEGGPGSGGLGNGGAVIPIDGGLGLLLAAGIGYGARRAYRQQKGKKSVQST